MIVRAKKTLYGKQLRKKGEVYEVSDERGRELVRSGYCEEVKQGFDDRKTKPQVEYREAGPYVQKFVGGEKVESLYKSEAKKRWNYDG